MPRGCPNEHDRPDRRRIEWIAYADGVAKNDISLKRFNLFAADDLVLKCSKTGRYAISDLAALDQRLNSVGAASYLCTRSIREHDAGLAGSPGGYRDNLLKCQTLAVEDYFSHYQVGKNRRPGKDHRYSFQDREYSNEKIRPLCSHFEARNARRAFGKV